MKRTLIQAGLFLMSCLLLPASGFAQFTRVSGTVQDSNGIPYAGGTISAVLVPGSAGGWRLSGQSYSGRLQNTSLDSTGSFTVQMGDNNVILPAGTQWLFTVNSNPGGIQPPLGTGAQTFTATITITGASQSISATLQAAAPKLTNITLGGGSVTNIATTAPITGGPITTTGTIGCATCTTGNVPSGDVAIGQGSNAISGSSLFTATASGLVTITTAIASPQELTLINSGAPGGALLFLAANSDGSGAISNGSGSQTGEWVFNVDGSISYVFTTGPNPFTFAPLGITFRGSTSGSAILGVAAVAGTPNQVNLPTSTGSNGQCLTTNGANPQQMAWAACSNISGLTTGFIPKAASATSLTNSLCDEGITVASTFSCSETISSTADGVHPGNISLVGNTTAVTPATSTFNILGPNVVTFTAYALQASSTPPTTGQCLVIGTVSASIAPLNYNTCPAGISGLTAGFIPKAASATSLANSLCDEAITTANAITCTDTAGIRAPSFTATGTTGGFFQCTQGTANGHATANTVTIECPSAVTAYELLLPAAAGTGIPHYTNAAGVITETISAIVAADCSVCVVNNAVNTATAAMTLDLSGSTVANAFKVPVGAGLTSGANGVIAYDTSAGNTHLRTNGADSIAAAEVAAIATGFFPEASDSTHGLFIASLCDEGVSTANAFTCTDTAGIRSPKFTSTGTTSGFVDYPQGTTSAAVAPCNAATSICEQAPTAVTSYLVTKPGVSATGIITNNLAAAVITQGFSGDANHSATVTTGSGTSIGSTTLCSSANCPAGTYAVNVYIDITTACGTTGTYVVNLIYTDDQGSKTVPVNINGTGAVPATGVLTTTSTANFGENDQIIRLTSGNLNYSTTAVACGTAGPMVGKLYMAAVPVM